MKETRAKGENMEKNKKNIMMISCIMFAYMGIAFLSQGALKLEIAESFGITTSKLQYLFTIFSTGSTVTVLLNKTFLEKISLKVEVLGASFVIVIGVILMISTTNIKFLILGLVLGGLGIGVYISLGNYLIMNTFMEDRNSKLNFLHSSYSISAVLTPIIAAALIGLNYSWNIIYLLLLSFVFIILYLGVRTDFGDIDHKGKENEKKNSIKDSKWSLKIYVSAVLLFLYVFTEMIFSYWIVEYIVHKGGLGQEAKISLSIFWLFIAGGRLLMGRIGYRFSVKSIVFVLLSVSLVSYIFLILANEMWQIYILVGVVGLGFSSLYPSISALGIEGRTRIEPSLMTFIMISGSVGGIVYSPISSWINTNYGIVSTMSFGVITTFTMLFLTILLKIKSK